MKWISRPNDYKSQFYRWYDSLDNTQQFEVDELADEMGLPLYDECSDAELSQLKDAYESF